MITKLDTKPFCGMIWDEFQRIMQTNIMGYVFFVITVLGILFNLLNMMIFTKKNMSSSNTLFLSLAISDFSVLSCSMPPLWVKYFLPHSIKSGYLSTAIHRYSNIFASIFSTSSTLHTMVLVIWRYIAVKYPLNEKQWCTMKMTVGVIVAIYLLSSLLKIPFHICNGIVPHVELVDKDGVQTNNQSIGVNRTVYQIAWTCDQLPTKLYNIFWYFQMIVLTGPLGVSSVCIPKLIQSLHNSQKRRDQLSPASGPGQSRDAEKKQFNQTVRMLLGVTLLFIIVQLTWIATITLTLIFGERFKTDCRLGMLFVTDSLFLIYTVIPFLIYYVTSQQFRKDYQSLFTSSIAVFTIRWGTKSNNTATSELKI